jgi:hypothetical protein
MPFNYRNRVFKTIFILGLSLLTYRLTYATENTTHPTIDPLAADTPPVIDGILDDPIWQKAPFVKGFKTWHPDYGKVMQDDTIAYMAYDRENLYFAFRCFDSQPQRIKSSVSRRDNIHDDDWIGINLDTFNDHQSLHVFYCNPLGIQSDSRFEGGTEDFSVDMVWYSEGKIDEQGYVVEVRIPLKSVRFRNKEPVEMGVIFERSIKRSTETGTYPPLDPVQGPNFLTQTMTLRYFDVKHYRLLEFIPAGTYSRQGKQEEGQMVFQDDQADLSLTGRYGITSDLIFDGTINPDFSQVESDAGQIDFNQRFALFYPEKRPFFLEGLEKFNFGGFHQGDPLREVVHTRTILEPILGFKLNGRVTQKDVIASIYAMDRLPEDEPDEHAHFGIVRYKRSLSKDSFIGGFYTGRERANGYNRVYGADGQIRLTQSSTFGFHLFNSNTHKDKKKDKTDGHILGLDYAYQTRDWIIALGLMDIDKDFETETGFITRTGLTRLRTGVLKMLYPKSGIIKRIHAMVHSYQTYDKVHELYETMNMIDGTVLLPRTTMILTGYRYSTEVFLGRKFSTNRYRLIAQSQITNKLGVAVNYFYGNKIRYTADPYQGKGNDASADVRFLPTDKLHLELTLAYSDFYRSSDSEKIYDYLITRGRLTYQVNKYLFFRGILEHNSFRKTLMTDFLASFTYIPGTVVHLGYGSFYEKTRWENGEYIPAENFLETRRGFFFKASYLWRF